MRHSLLPLLFVVLSGLALAEPAYTPRFARMTGSAEILTLALCPRPSYPKSSARNEEQGTTTLRFVIGADGRLVETVVERSSGFRALDDAAYAALTRCRFRPAAIDGVPVRMTTSVDFVWSIE